MKYCNKTDTILLKRNIALLRMGLKYCYITRNLALPQNIKCDVAKKERM